MNRIILKYVGILLTLCFFIPHAIASHDLTHKRAAYSTWRNEGNRLSNNDQINLLNQLNNYPLFSYAEFNYIAHHIDSVSDNRILNFIQHYADSPLSLDLKRLYIWTLYKQKKWHSLLSAPRDQSIQTQCYYYYAKYQHTPNKETLEPMRKIWLTGKSLPPACDHVLETWKKSGGRTANLILLRIELAMKAGNRSLVRYLAKELPENYKTTREALLMLLESPKNIVAFSERVAPTRFSKKMVLYSFPRLARQNPGYAQTIISDIVLKQQLSEAEERKFKAHVAWQYFNPNATDSQKEWRDTTIAGLRNTALTERRIREALRNKNDDDLNTWLTKLSSKAQKKDEWHYWMAMMLEKQGKKKEAREKLSTLSKHRGFYGMVSAQKLGRPYHYDFNYPVVEGQSPENLKTILLKRYNTLPVVQRIIELLHWKNDTAARREWLFFISQPENEPKLAELARFAHLKGWSAYSIQATIVGKLWDNWIERFPPAYIDIFKEALDGKELPLSYSLAISRQESALQPMVISPAGARGLMQLMPATAKDIAQKISDLQYHSVEQLYEPETNIVIGTHFLESMYQQFQKNRILSAAAYNAGPARARRWLEETGGKLDAVAFIETIPFTETRNYVKSVLVYDYIYQLILKRTPNAFIVDNEMNRFY